VWPHLITLGLGDTAVVIATDDDSLVTVLTPWTLADSAGLDLQTVDFTAELHPVAPGHRAIPRTIPAVRHGACVLERSTDIVELRTGLLRVLQSLHQEVPEGCVRVAGMPLMRNGRVELATLRAGADGNRALRRRGFQPICAGSVVVDPHAMTVQIPPPLGSAELPTDAPLHAWWSELPDAQPGWSFGQRVAMTAPRISSWVRGDADTSSQLAALVALMERLGPRAASEPFA
jgi:hypothetical protein